MHPHPHDSVAWRAGAPVRVRQCGRTTDDRRPESCLLLYRRTYLQVLSTVLYVSNDAESRPHDVTPGVVQTARPGTIFHQTVPARLM